MAISQKLFWVLKICKKQGVALLEVNKIRLDCEKGDLSPIPFRENCGP